MSNLADGATIPLKRLITSIESGVSVNAIDVPAENGQVGVLKTSCVYAGHFDSKENKTVVVEDIGRVACPVRANTLVVSRMNTPDLVGAAGLVMSDEKEIYLPDRLWQIHFDHEASDPRFVYWWTRSELYRDQVKMACAGTSSSMQNLDQASFRGFAVPNIKRSAQTYIANFLDEKTARIDALIAEKERLLLAVKELFVAKLGTAVVEGAAGCGTSRNEEAKGFESVRTDWALVPLKHLTAVSGGMTPSKDKPEYWEGDIPWVSPKDMKRFEIGDSADHVTQKALDETALRLHSPDSVLVVVRGMILAHTFPVALTTAPVTINQDMKALRTTGRISPKYLAWMLRGLQSLMLSLTEESAHGTKALRTDQWANQHVPVPSPEEQVELVTLFERWSAETLQLSEHLDEHIDRLREYRSSLISAAVTGQLDIGAVKEVT